TLENPGAANGEGQIQRFLQHSRSAPVRVHRRWLLSGKDRNMRHTRFLVSAATVALACAGTQPASAAPWVKGYVVGAYEYAFRYGGRPDFSRGAEIEPG